VILGPRISRRHKIPLQDDGIESKQMHHQSQTIHDASPHAINQVLKSRRSSTTQQVGDKEDIFNHSPEITPSIFEKPMQYGQGLSKH
jgi:hypothetical protein